MDTKIELSESLWGRAVEAAQARGYASVQQFVSDLIERELANQDSASNAEIARKMEDLGYLDYGLDI